MTGHEIAEIIISIMSTGTTCAIAIIHAVKHVPKNKKKVE